MPLAKIVYASMTGNTEACADIVADKLEELGFEVELDECSSVDADEMADADLVSLELTLTVTVNYLTKLWIFMKN